MGLDCYTELKFPPEMSRKELEKYFMQAGGDEIWRYWYPTKEYLDVFLTRYKKNTISYFKKLNPNRSEEEIIEVQGIDDEAKLFEYFATRPVYEPKNNSDKSADGSLILTDTYRVTSYGSTLSCPALISELLPGVKIEKRGEDDTRPFYHSISTYLNGECIDNREVFEAEEFQKIYGSRNAKVGEMKAGEGKKDDKGDDSSVIIEDDGLPF